MTFRQRRPEPEQIDDPSLDERRHYQSLRGLARLNWCGRGAPILWHPIRAWLDANGRRRARLLDIATGAGDVPIRLWRCAKRHGYELEIEGCDRSQRAVAYAARQAARAEAPVRFFAFDVLQDPAPEGYDLIVNSLFLHHLQDEEAVEFLRRMSRAAHGLLLISDLVRSPGNAALVAAGTQLLSRSPVVHRDGMRSIQAAFTLDEVHTLSGQAGLAGYTLEARWPCRLLLQARGRCEDGVRA